MCESAVFTLKHRDGQLQLECREHERQPWRVELPLAIEQGEDDAAEIYVDEESLAESIELLPDEGLAESISEIVDRYLPGYTFDARIESFLVRGPNLIYYPDRSKVYDSQLNGEKTVIYVTQKIANLKGGEVIGVSTDPAEV
jgi:hypothetical protein